MQVETKNNGNGQKNNPYGLNLQDLDYIRSLHDFGYHVCPLTVNGAKLCPWEWPTPGPDGMRPAFEWWRLENHFTSQESGLGIFTGYGPPGFHLEVFDFDVDAQRIFPDWLDIIRSTFPELVKRFYVVETPKPGYHVYTLSPMAYPGKKLAERPAGFTIDKRSGRKQEKRDCLIETRGLGHLVAAVGGSVHQHRLAKPYKVLQGDIFNVPVLTDDQRDIMLENARDFNRCEVRERPVSSTTRDYSDDNSNLPSAKFARRVTWGELLTKDGWKDCGTTGDVTYWTRPDKTDGQSATTGYGGRDLLHVFTSSTLLEAGRSYTKAGYVCEWSFGGDWDATLKYITGGAAEPEYETADVYLDALGGTKTVNEAHDAPANGPPPSQGNTKAQQADAQAPAAKGKFEPLARAFLADVRGRGEVPLYHGGRFYLYAPGEGRYVECDELPMKLRSFMSARGLGQSNNVVGNVVPIVQAAAWRDQAVFGPMPFHLTNKAFDRKNIVSYRNGLLDINTAVLVPHTPDWCSTVCLPFDFDPAATCPTWLRFLGEVFEDDQTRAALVQEWFGYCMTADTSLQKALVFVGKPRSGKGTIQGVLGALIGPSATGFSLDKLASEFGLSALKDKTVALVGEVELAGNKDRNKIVEIWKSIIGEDEVSVNEKHNPKFASVRLGARFLVSANTMPRLMDSSAALFHRLLFVPFEKSFAGKEDTHLQERLRGELPGIANWALEGLRRLRAAGGRFTLGDGSRRLSDQYAAAASPIYCWVRTMAVSKWADPGDLPPECVSDDAELSITKADAFFSYQEWCEDHNVEPTSLQWFSSDLATVLPKITESKVKNAVGQRPRTFKGLGVPQKVPS